MVLIKRRPMFLVCHAEASMSRRRGPFRHFPWLRRRGVLVRPIISRSPRRDEQLRKAVRSAQWLGDVRTPLRKSKPHHTGAVWFGPTRWGRESSQEGPV
ncbi:hypothetical protein SKAU_G00195860 [Synaphobranchus kaupii]|uniref:Uncharacterized protein n=1 Tax=Synaphobranchus kaupii TaxID=118154 RepID=A0A9Q1FEP6_SYNKA|nr:hypothetical protein SKAU_G00195860 [Synaphobranchus kaupii]